MKLTRSSTPSVMAHGDDGESSRGPSAARKTIVFQTGDRGGKRVHIAVIQDPTEMLLPTIVHGASGSMAFHIDQGSAS